MKKLVLNPINGFLISLTLLFLYFAIPAAEYVGKEVVRIESYRLPVKYEIVDKYFVDAVLRKDVEPVYMLEYDFQRIFLGSDFEVKVSPEYGMYLVRHSSTNWIVCRFSTKVQESDDMFMYGDEVSRHVGDMPGEVKVVANISWYSCLVATGFITGTTAFICLCVLGALTLISFVIREKFRTWGETRRSSAQASN